MSVKISGKYLGNKNVSIIHEQSGMSSHTAAPLDNQGDGTSFSPTDLVAAALGSCVLTIMGILAERDQINLDKASFTVEKQMQEQPRRISQLDLIVKLPAELNDAQRQKYETAAHKCPVYKSLHPEIVVNLNFEYV